MIAKKKKKIVPMVSDLMKTCLPVFLVFLSVCCYSQSELYKAVDGNDMVKLKAMFDGSPELINKDTDSSYPVFLAAEKLRPDMVKYLIEKGARLDVKTGKNEDNIILHLARTMFNPAYEKRAGRYIELIDLLASHKVSFNVTGKDGHGPLYLVALKGGILTKDVKNYMGIMDAYIRNGSSITDKGNACALHGLLKTKPTQVAKKYDFGNFEAAKEFVALGANVNEVDEEKNTPLHIVLMAKPATDDEKIDIVKTLIEKGAKTNMKNKDGKTPEDLVKKESPLYEILKKTKMKK